jgi:hypothetical protein
VRFHLGTSDINTDEGKDGDDADVYQDEAAVQVDDRSTQNVED